MTEEELKILQKEQEKAAEGTVQETEDSAAPAYAQSQQAQDYQAEIDRLLSEKPADYQNSYAETIDNLLNKVLNREAFQYDMNADPLYQQYKDDYTAQGKKTMRDVMGQAAALTGGYGSSYATTAGSQAYQDTMSKLNSMVPELYSQAAARYDSQGQQMLNDLSAANSLQNAELNAYSQNTDNYYNALSTQSSLYSQQQAADLQAYQTALSKWQYDQDQALAAQQSAQAQQNWLAEQLVANTKKLKEGYTGMQLIMAFQALGNGAAAAMAYINQLKLSKSAKANLLKALGLNG